VKKFGNTDLTTVIGKREKAQTGKTSPICGEMKIVNDYENI
tara:strand:+ start:2175 stop:2297 length:123 start_codon:yes stop_codon:yes gene_type:complete